ncbi:MAG: S9 family peptidase [Acidimicrobiia bacterium]|nr:S9 family peptidase [Acidimicrobiia bacterium]
MGEGIGHWLGKAEHYGVPSLTRPDAPKAAHWSLEGIGAVNRPHDPVVSPDGNAVSVVFDRDTSDIWIVLLSGDSPYQLTAGRELAAFWEDDPATWSPDGRTIAYTADGFVWVVAAAGGLPKKVMEGSSPDWISDTELVVLAERDDESRLVRVSTDDPWPVALTGPGYNVSGAAVSVKHGVVVYVNYPNDDLQNSEIWVHDLRTGESQRLTDEPGMHDGSPRLSPDGLVVAFTSERSGWYEIYLVNRDGSSLGRLTSDEADFSGLDWSSDGATLAGIRTRDGVSDLVTVSTDSGQVTVLSKGGEWSWSQWANDGVVAVHESHTTPPRLVHVAGDGEIRTLLESVPASIRVAPYAGFEEVRYQSLDGTEIHGFLFRPTSVDSETAPVIVYPHGGPTSAYMDAWDGHAQYFIDKGYGWFAINFRGSTSYGRDFERANHGVWGVADTEDCLAAADYLRGLDWVDGSRLGIFGASYGSYLALASLAGDPEYRFACGVAKYGDSDIATSWAQGDRGGREDLERMMGRPADNRAAYREGSPLSRVENIQRPILVAHGEKDIRVHPDQSAQLVEELRRLGKTFEYVTYPTEGHGLLRADPQIHFYQRLERFLDWHLM